MAQQIINNERSIGELFTELAGETSTLIRQEVALAQAELTQKATKAGKNVGYLAVGGSIAFVGFQALIAALIIGLAYVIPAWAAALLVGVIIVVAGAIFIVSALNSLKSMDAVPRQTVETIKEDGKWLKNQVS